MGAREDVPPWQRGGTFSNMDPAVTDPTNVQLYGPGGSNLEGRTYVFEANADATQLTYSTTGADPTGRQTAMKVLRNKTNISLMAGRLVHYDATTSGVPYEAWCDGYCNAVGDRPAGIVDDFIGPLGVPPGDLFYAVIGGPTRACNTDTTQTAWNIGDRLVPATAGASRTDDAAGRLVKQDLTGATAALGNNIQNVVGFGAATVTSGSVATVGTVLIPIVVRLNLDMD